MFSRLLLILYTAWSLACAYGEMSLDHPQGIRLFVLIACPWLIYKVLRWGICGSRRTRTLRFDAKSGRYR